MRNITCQSKRATNPQTHKHTHILTRCTFPLWSCDCANAIQKTQCSNGSGGGGRLCTCVCVCVCVWPARAHNAGDTSVYRIKFIYNFQFYMHSTLLHRYCWLTSKTIASNALRRIWCSVALLSVYQCASRNILYTFSRPNSMHILQYTEIEH